MNIQANLVRLAYGSTLMDSGYTLWNDESTKYKGFVVGGMTHESECEIDDCLGFRTLFDSYLSMAHVFRQSSGDAHANPHMGVGTWVDGGKIYFDVVKFYESEQDAIDMAKALGEKAYFDIFKNKSVYL
mgnify:FL=1|tara:strand:- start:1276 stop:1662 length:387 start_codon:yes stop_codon:yes gene_type:complete